ncbi:MAG TPA: T9SS type A sorting domain-containing protein, partial [Bacteroidia bacterium]|nr:T9SS type A sorting domain-containing protein [Bacteroidia bacterium]
GGGSYCAGTISGTPVASNTSNGSVSITYTATGSTTYTVTGTSASGCTGTATVTVTVLPVPSVTTGVTNITCNGLTNGTATANVTGGTAPYNYVWSDASSQTTATATGLSAGTYSVTVTDANGCSSVVSVATVIEPAVMTVTTSSTRSTGSDGTATANVSGGTAPYSYVWSDASSQTTATATGLSVGSYTVIVNDVNGCGAVTDSITVIPTLVVNSVTEVATGCYNTNGTIIVNASGGIPPYTYYVTGYYTYGVIDNNGSSNTMPFPGPYCDYIQVQVTDANGYTAYLDWSYLCPDGTTPGNPALCYVTADTALEQNTINWSNSGLNLSDLSNFNIYKEETTGYVLVGTTIPSATSFVDATSHSDIESNYYQITATDTCGVESPISNNVETVLLQANWGVGSVVNLSWNAYQNSTGNVVAYYVILRDTGTGFHNYDSVPFNIYAYTDLKPTTGALQYMVNTVFNGLSCTSATSSHSNKKVIKVVTGINEIIASSSINVYPNPVSDQVTVAVNTNVDGMLSIVDVLGQVVYSDRIVSTGNTVKHIGTTGFSQGVYFLKITSNGQEVVKKFIKL